MLSSCLCAQVAATDCFAKVDFLSNTINCDSVVRAAGVHNVQNHPRRENTARSLLPRP